MMRIGFRATPSSTEQRLVGVLGGRQEALVESIPGMLVDPEHARTSAGAVGCVDPQAAAVHAACRLPALRGCAVRVGSLQDRHAHVPVGRRDVDGDVVSIAAKLEIEAAIAHAETA